MLVGASADTTWPKFPKKPSKRRAWGKNEGNSLLRFPWSNRTIEEWRIIDPIGLKRSQEQAAWLILCAAKQEKQEDLHDADFLRRWDLINAYQALFGQNPALLDSMVGRHLNLEARASTRRDADSRRSKREEAFEALLPILSDSHMLPFLIQMKAVRHQSLVEAREEQGRVIKERGHVAHLNTPHLVFWEEAATQLAFDEATTKTVHEKYLLLISELERIFTKQLNGNSFGDYYRYESEEDRFQHRVAEMIDSLAIFQHWESWYIDPRLTVSRLVPYLLQSLQGYEKGVDAYAISFHLGKSRDGEDMSMDMYRSTTVDPAEVAVADLDYTILQKLVREISTQLGLDPRAPEILESYADGSKVGAIAKQFNLPNVVVSQTILRLRKALAERIDPTKSLRRVTAREESPVWSALVDVAEAQRLRDTLHTRPLRGFHGFALLQALEYGQNITQADGNEQVLELKQVRKDVIRYVAASLIERYPNVNPIKAEDTARRSIQTAYNVLMGVEAYGNDGRYARRGSYAVQPAEKLEWRAFVDNNPDWEHYFNYLQRETVRYYYLEQKHDEHGDRDYTQTEIAAILNVDASRVSRALDTVNKQRIRMRRIAR